MSRAHSYAQVPLAEHGASGTTSSAATSRTAATREDTLAFARSQKKKTTVTSNDHRGYASLNSHISHPLDEDDDDDEFEHAAEDSLMLRPHASSSSSSSSAAASFLSSAPRRSVYPSPNGHDDDDDGNDYDEDGISIAPPIEGSSSGASSSAAAAAAGSLGASGVSGSRWSNGARTTNVSFLARLTGRQRPERDARRIIQSTMDGVFSNLSAKPRVEKPYEEELPPSYKTAAQDVSPAYYESNILSSGFVDEDDMILVEGLPVGGLFGFVWNVIISMSFQFVGFFLTYLLHTSHATKQGAKTGLGITFISMGFKVMNGELLMDDSGSVNPSTDPLEDSDTGYIGNTGPSYYYDTSSSSSFSSSMSIRSLTEYEWLSYLMVILGGLIIAHSLTEFAKVKRAETIQLASSAEALESTVPADTAAGHSLSATLAAFAALASSTSRMAANAASSSPSTAAATTADSTSGSGSRTVVIAMT